MKKRGLTPRCGNRNERKQPEVVENLPKRRGRAGNNRSNRIAAMSPAQREAERVQGMVTAH